MSHPLIVRDEQSGLLMRIAATESVTLCTRRRIKHQLRGEPCEFSLRRDSYFGFERQCRARYPIYGSGQKNVMRRK